MNAVASLLGGTFRLRALARAGAPRPSLPRAGASLGLWACLALGCGLSPAQDLARDLAPDLAPNLAPNLANPPADAPASPRKPAAPVLAIGHQAKAAPMGPALPGLGPGARTEDERNTMAIFKLAAPSTVFVTQSKVVNDFWNRRRQAVPTGSGSGFIWDNKGHIVTNAHVVGDPNRRRVSGQARYEVTLFGGKRYPAKLVGVAEKKDLAVLKIQAPKAALRALGLAPAHAPLAVGQKTVAIGNPFGLDHTLTTGVISALNREVVGFGGVTIRDMIQTDASINPGNSGGPLLNSSGQLIGINTMIFSKSGSSAGIGFAVPVSTVRRLVPQLITHGAPRQVGIGVVLADDSIPRRLGVDGVVFYQVARNGPAHKAGLLPLRRNARTGAISFDVIESVDGTSVHSFDDLYNALDPHNPGDQVSLGILRGQKRFTVQVTLQVISDGDLQ